MTAHRLPVTTTGVALLATVALAACSSETEPETPTSTPAAESAPTTEQPMEETTEAAETTEEATEADAATSTTAPPEGSAAGGTGEVSPPGTAVAVGESAVTHVQAGQEGDEFYGYALLNTTVTSIETGDPSYFEQFDNADELEGLVRYFIIAEHEIIEFEGEPNDNMTSRLNGVLENSQDATTLVALDRVLCAPLR